MKRIAENVALATVLYSVSGTQKIRIIDRESIWADNTTLVYEGAAIDFSVIHSTQELSEFMRVHKVSFYDLEHAAIHGFAAIGDVLQITLQTNADTN